MHLPAAASGPCPEAEAAQAYAQAQYALMDTRFGWLEEKAARYLTAVSIVLGTGELMVGKPAIEILKEQWHHHWTEIALVVAAAAMTIVGTIAALAALWVHRPQKLPTPSVDPAVIDAYKTNSLADACWIQAERMLADAKAIRAVNEGRARSLRVAFWAMSGSFVLFAVSVGLLFVVKRIGGG